MSVAQSCPTLFNHMDSVHGFLQARNYWQLTQSRSKCHHDGWCDLLQNQKGMLSFKEVVLLTLGEGCPFWLSRFFCQWGRFGQCLMQIHCSHEIKRRLLLGRKAMTNLDSILKSRDITANKGPSSQCCGFSTSHVQMWELDHKESWVPKNGCFQIVVLEKILESPLDCKEIHPVHPKGNQSWIFIERTDAETESSNTLGTWCEELTHWKRPWCWERLKDGREGDDREWDG